MANLFKKVIAGAVSAAIAASLAVMPAFAAATVVLDGDYTSSADGWEVNSTSNATIECTSGYTQLSDNDSNSARIFSVALAEAVSGSFVVEYDIQPAIRTNANSNAMTVYVGSNNSESNAIALLKFDRPSTTGGDYTAHANGADFTISNTTATDKDRQTASPWLHIKHIIDADTTKVTTTVTDTDNNIELYSGTADYVNPAITSIGGFYISVPRNISWCSVKTVKITKVDSIPSIAFEDISYVEVGVRTKIATISGYTSYDVGDCEVDEDGSVYLTASSAGTQDVTISLDGDIPVSDSTTLTALSADGIADSVANGLTIAYADDPETALTATEGVYDVIKDLYLVNTIDSKTTVSWSEATGAIGADGVIYPKASDDTVTLTATVTYKGSEGNVTDTKDFTIQLPNAEEYIDLAIASLTATSADDTTVIYDLDNIGTVKTDIALPTKSVQIYMDSDDNVTLDKTITVDETQVTNKNIGKVAASWEVSASSNKVSAEVTSDGVVKCTLSAFGTYEVTLTGTFTYGKDGKDSASVEKTYTYKIEFTSSDKDSEDTALDKYKVRYDAAYDDNFDIPEQTTEDITLNTDGYFGSDIVWGTSNTEAISKRGKVTQLSSKATVKLTATITSGSESVDKTFTVVVPKSSTSSSKSGGGGGGGATVASSSVMSSTISNGVTNAASTVAALQQEAVLATDKFKDISEASWAREAINALAEAGVINGKSDTEFAPNDTVTRAEFAKMLMAAMGLSSNAYSTSSFRDVSTSDWCFEYVEAAYNLGIINGVADGVFAPNAQITRQDMAVMVVRAAAVAGESVAEAGELSFTDAASIADYAKDAVASLTASGIVNGMDDGSFAPAATATRAQAAKILYNFL